MHSYSPILERVYTIHDIDEYVQKFIQIKLGGMRRNHEAVSATGEPIYYNYVLDKAQIDKADDKSYIVALTPAIDQRSQPFNLYLTPQKGRRIKEDVLEEIISVIQHRAKAQVKILYPYNHRDNQVWSFDEIKIFKDNTEYAMEITSHNPIDNDMRNEHEKGHYLAAIKDRLAKLIPGATITSCVYKTSPYPSPRIDDEYACGVMVATEITRRIMGKTLSTEPCLTISEISDLRIEHLKFISEYFPADEKRKDGFIARNAKKQPLKKSPSADAHKAVPAHANAGALAKAEVAETEQEKEKPLVIDESLIGQPFSIMRLEADGKVTVGSRPLTPDDLAIYRQAKTASQPFTDACLTPDFGIEHCLALAQIELFNNPTLVPLYPNFIMDSFNMLLMGLSRLKAQLKDFGYLLTNGLNVTVFEQFAYYLYPNYIGRKNLLPCHNNIRLALLPKILLQDLPEIVRFLRIIQDIRAYMANPAILPDTLLTNEFRTNPIRLAELVAAHQEFIACTTVSERKRQLVAINHTVKAGGLTHSFRNLFQLSEIGARYDALEAIESSIAMFSIPAFTNKRQQHAMLHLLLVIGENIKKIPKQVRDLYPLAPWQLKDIRDEIEHQYDIRRRKGELDGKVPITFHYDSSKAEVILDFLDGEFIAEGLSWTSLKRDLTNLSNVIQNIKTRYYTVPDQTFWQEYTDGINIAKFTHKLSKTEIALIRSLNDLGLNEQSLREITCERQLLFPDEFCKLKTAVISAEARTAVDKILKSYINCSIRLAVSTGLTHDELKWLIDKVNTIQPDLAKKLMAYFEQGKEKLFFTPEDINAIHTAMKRDEDKARFNNILQNLQPTANVFMKKFASRYAIGKRLSAVELLEACLDYSDNIMIFEHDLVHDNNFYIDMIMVLDKKFGEMDKAGIAFYKQLNKHPEWTREEILAKAPASAKEAIALTDNLFAINYERQALSKLHDNPILHNALAYNVRVLLSLLGYVADLPKLYNVDRFDLLNKYKLLEQFRNYLAHDDNYLQRLLKQPKELSIYKVLKELHYIRDSFTLILREVEAKQTLAIYTQSLTRRFLIRHKCKKLAENRLSEYERLFLKHMKDIPKPKRTIGHYGENYCLPIFGLSTQHTDFATVWAQYYAFYIEAVRLYTKGSYPNAIARLYKAIAEINEAIETRQAERKTKATAEPQQKLPD